MKKLAIVTALVGSIVMASPASAATLFYNFTALANTPSFTFTLDTDRPRATTSSLFETRVTNYTLNGEAQIRDPYFVRFNSSSISGGLSAPGFAYRGPQLFSGTTDKPTYLTGRFLFDNGTLNVTDFAAAVPEPATWAMMLVGFGMIGATARYRRRSSKVAYA